jgi:spermidine synthase
VVRLARDPNMFRFLASCAPSAPIVLGDARLTLNASREQFDVIMLDAFTSDAIPTHLLTREALRGYLAHLKPHGVIVANITNRHIELASVFAAVGASEGLVMMRRADQGARQFMIDFHAPATAAALARSEEDLGSLVQASGWQRIDRGNVVPWTDDYADIMGAILRKKLGS